MRRFLGRLSSNYVRFHSTSSSVSPQPPTSSLDLDFILNLLDSSQSKSSSTGPAWSKMKYKEFKLVNLEGDSVEVNNKFESGSNNFTEGDFGTFIDSSSTESTLDRLQSLADSLPTEVFDRSQPPVSFFEMESASNALKNLSEEPVKFAPILKRENVDWSTVTLTSILKKIVPEEVFMKSGDESVDERKNTLEMKPNAKMIKKFTLSELKLLDRDQLHALAKLNSVSCEQSDHKVEKELLSKFECVSPKKVSSSKSATISRDKIPWTAENEAALLKLYEDLRVEKQNIDQKLQSVLESGHVESIVKRGKSSSDRGFWAVLAERFKHSCKYHVSVTECRNKLIILKRLKFNNN